MKLLSFIFNKKQEDSVAIMKTTTFTNVNLDTIINMPENTLMLFITLLLLYFNYKFSHYVLEQNINMILIVVK